MGDSLKLRCHVFDMLPTKIQVFGLWDELGHAYVQTLCYFQHKTYLGEILWIVLFLKDNFKGIYIKDLYSLPYIYLIVQP